MTNQSTIQLLKEARLTILCLLGALDTSVYSTRPMTIKKAKDNIEQLNEEIERLQSNPYRSGDFIEGIP
jgi:hypothetical protein